MGAWFDQALDAGLEVDTLNVTNNNSQIIAKAYRDAARIPNAQIRGLATALVGWEIADNTKYVDSSI